MTRVPPTLARLVRSNDHLHRAALWGLAEQQHFVNTRRRRAFAKSYYEDKLRLIKEWAPKYTENQNFYYDLAPRNRAYLASLVSVVTGEPVEVVEGYIRELTEDEALREHIATGLQFGLGLSDATVGFGRREGWYAIIRSFKPRMVVETGVHQGVGACVICSALLRNAEEGHPGLYCGTDIDRAAGFLLNGPYAECAQVLYGDSLESLATLDGPIDVFINDSDHSVAYEAAEYRAIESKLADRSIILGDNSHVTSELLEFAKQRGRPFVFFREDPIDHWYPGAGIGISPSAVPLDSN